MKKSLMAEAIMEERYKNYQCGVTAYMIGFRSLMKLSKEDLTKIYFEEVVKEDSTMKKLYVCYGSNLNVNQMSHRCPDAKIYGSGVIKNYRLSFYSVASIEPEEGDACPVGVWEISERDEAHLDIYEGWPSLYRKEDIEVTMDNGETVTAMVYIMNRSGVETPPSQSYYDCIETGYRDFGLNKKYLKESVRKFGAGAIRGYNAKYSAFAY